MTDYDDYDDDLADPADLADFDAFLGEVEEARAGLPFRMYGRTYRLPASMPLLFTLHLHRLKESARPQDVEALLTTLFGTDAIDRWTQAGMDDRRLGVVLMWATTNVAKPGTLSLEQAAALYDERETAKATAGKARPAKARTKATPKKKTAARASSSGGR